MLIVVSHPYARDIDDFGLAIAAAFIGRVLSSSSSSRARDISVAPALLVRGRTGGLIPVKITRVGATSLISFATFDSLGSWEDALPNWAAFPLSSFKGGNALAGSTLPIEEAALFKAVPVVPTMEGRGAREIILEPEVVVLVFERAPEVKTGPVAFALATLPTATDVADEAGIVDCRRAAIASDARPFTGDVRVTVDAMLIRGFAAGRGGGGAIDPRGRGAIDVLGTAVTVPAVPVLAVDARGAMERRELSEATLAVGPFEAMENLGNLFPADDLLGLADIRL